MKQFFKKLAFFTAFIIPSLVVAGFYLDDYWNFLAIVFSFLLIPLIDQSLGTDTSNVAADEAKIVGEEFYYRFVTYVWTYVQIAFVGWAAYAVTTGKLNSIWEWAAFTLSVALVTGGIGITVAHELGHKKSALERFYGKVLLMTVSYMHFYIEHNRGHHVHVATPEDPATAHKDENFYAFWIRSVFGGYIHAWKLQRESLARKNKSVWSIHNEMSWFAVLPILFCAALTIVFSIILNRITWEVPVFFFAQSFLAFTLLELVNYIEHYGIMRKEISAGRYERVNPLHSWNASHMLSNFFLFQLQRHSDHHAFAYKRYQVLNHYDESPQLPFGYPTMIIIALVPPVWFGMMNRRLEQWESVRQTTEVI
ncbi:MAG TPA: alkane 1-monooxygenase [Chryseosolibacter sp.]